MIFNLNRVDMINWYLGWINSMSVGLDIKWCPLSRITDRLSEYAQKGNFKHFKTGHIYIPATAFIWLKYCRCAPPINQSINQSIIIMFACLPLGAGLNLFEGDIKDYHRRLQHIVSKALHELFSSKMLNNIDYT